MLLAPRAASGATPTIDATRRSRKAAKSSRSFALRLQRVDGRRIDALVADMLCSRLHGVAAPTVSYVSAPLVRRASVHLCECVCVCALLPVRVGVLVGGPDFVCVGACVFACRAKSTDGGSPSGVLEAASAGTV